MSALWQSVTSRINALIASLAGTASAGQGAGQVGFLYALAYGAGTLGAWLQGLAQSTGSTFVGWIQAGVGAVLRTIQSKLRESVSVMDFGAVGDGVTDDTAAFTKALATGKNVFVPDPPAAYLITATLSLATAYQRIFGNGWNAKLNFQLTAAGPGIATSNPTGWQSIEGLYLNGVSNVTKVISIGSPDLSVLRNYVYNATPTGHGIYQEDENTGANTYVFDARIDGNLIYGQRAVGTYGIRLGLNHQGSKLLRNSVQNWGYLIYVNGATSITTIMFNILQRSDITGAVPAAIIISKAGSGMPCYNIGIEHNYFEQNLVCVYADDCDLENLCVRKNYAYRNTPSQAGSSFYCTGVNTNAASCRIVLDDNRSDGFAYFATLNDQYSANITSGRNNTVVNNVGYVAGTFASSLYKIREHNAYFGAVASTGAFASQGTTRVEMQTGTFRMFLRWDPHEYLESIQFKYLPIGSTPNVTVNLHQVTGDTDTVLLTTGPVTAGGVVTLAVNAYAAAGSHYYLEFVCALGGGTTAYFYPAQLWLRD